MCCILVDWSGGWATPWGSASQMRPWSEQREWSGSSDAPRKAPSRNGNQPHVLVKSQKVFYVNATILNRLSIKLHT